MPTTQPPKKCRPSRFAVIRGGRAQYSFRCARHGLAYEMTYSSPAELKRGIRLHREAFRLK